MFFLYLFFFTLCVGLETKFTLLLSCPYSSPSALLYIYQRYNIHIQYMLFLYYILWHTKHYVMLKNTKNFPKCILHIMYDGALPCHVFYLCFSSLDDTEQKQKKLSLCKCATTRYCDLCWCFRFCRCKVYTTVVWKCTSKIFQFSNHDVFVCVLSSDPLNLCTVVNSGKMRIIILNIVHTYISQSNKPSEAIHLQKYIK